MYEGDMMMTKSKDPRSFLTRLAQIGLGVLIGEFTTDMTYNAMMVTENFAFSGTAAYLTGVVIAPQMLMPNQWLPAILDAVLPRIDPSRFQRFMDLVMMRAQAASDMASEPGEFFASIARRSKKAQGDWASGFSEALDRFRSAWPKRGMTAEDRRLIEIGAAGLAGVDGIIHLAGAGVGDGDHAFAAPF